jgi:uracil-DNA glycosylase
LSRCATAQIRERLKVASSLDRLVCQIRACRVCVEAPRGVPLPHEPRPVLRVSSTARLAVVGQAPGTRVHASGVPFSDPSGDRLRDWMGVTGEEFYDVRRVAIIPMGFCYPGQDSHGGDLPPRAECAPLWHERLFAQLPQIELMLLIGGYAQRWHLDRAQGVTATVEDWRAVLQRRRQPRFLPLPHPSWRNNAWLKAHPWFEAELVPRLRREVRRRLG